MACIREMQSRSGQRGNNGITALGQRNKSAVTVRINACAAIFDCLLTH